MYKRKTLSNGMDNELIFECAKVAIILAHRGDPITVGAKVESAKTLLWNHPNVAAAVHGLDVVRMAMLDRQSRSGSNARLSEEMKYGSTMQHGWHISISCVL